MPRLRSLVISLAALAFAAQIPAMAQVPIAKSYEWEAGAVFRSFSFFQPPPDTPFSEWPLHIYEVDPGNSTVASAKARRIRPLKLDISGASRAELVLEHMPVHISTLGWFTVNWKESRRWVPLPLPLGTPGDPLQYHFAVLGGLPLPLPLEWLRQGDNDFRFTAGPQNYHLFNTGDPARWGYGCLWIYDFTVRVFHPRGPEHPQVMITSPATGDTIGENPVIAFHAEPGKAPIKRVDIIACYDGYNVSGSGFSREWHAQFRYGVPTLHVGSTTDVEGPIIWNTTWIPDQDLPVRLVALATDETGWTTVSPIVDNFRFTRHDRSVRLISASGVPPRFSVTYGQEKSCTFDLGKLPTPPTRACLQIASNFGGPKLEQVKFNGVEIARRVGLLHRCSVDYVDVPLALIHPGSNRYSIYSTETEHGPEMNWPGPVLLLEFNRN